MLERHESDTDRFHRRFIGVTNGHIYVAKELGPSLNAYHQGSFFRNKSLSAPSFQLQYWKDLSSSEETYWENVDKKLGKKASLAVQKPHKAWYSSFSKVTSLAPFGFDSLLLTYESPNPSYYTHAKKGVPTQANEAFTLYLQKLIVEDNEPSRKGRPIAVPNGYMLGIDADVAYVFVPLREDENSKNATIDEPTWVLGEIKSYYLWNYFN
ncbi:MAG: hypothetical protein QNK37_17590 [Acidobacteriota bacterium]|nr:hypothetical protein [Acidobacteriota bacterium]